MTASQSQDRPSAMPAKRRLKTLLRAELLTPQGLVVRAVGVAVLFAICHLAGLREHTTFLSGTAATAQTGAQVSVVWGLIYIVAYLGFVVLVPILVLAASLLAGWTRFKPNARMPSENPPPSL